MFTKKRGMPIILGRDADVVPFACTICRSKRLYSCFVVVFPYCTENAAVPQIFPRAHVPAGKKST